MKRIIEINIDEIVLVGLENQDASSISRAVQAGVSRMLEEKGISGDMVSSTNIDRIDGGSFRLSRTAGAEQIGNAIAGPVYQGITNQTISSKK